MSYVLSLIAAEPKQPLSAADVDRARSLLEGAGASVGAPDWLAADEACDIHFEGSPEAALAVARSGFVSRPFDVNVIAGRNRRKRLLLADMDSTLIRQECIDELAAEAGVGPQVAAITERAMRGEIDFEPALRERVGMLKGLATDAVTKVLSERIDIMPGAAVLVGTMRHSGAYTALISGGFTAFADPIAERLGFQEHRANILLAEAGVFTGSLGEPVHGRTAKQEALLDLAARLGVDVAEALAVGDGANDIGMIKAAGMGVAYRAKPAVRAAAAASIEHGDLTALLFLQGYRRDEFVLRSHVP